MIGKAAPYWLNWLGWDVDQAAQAMKEAEIEDFLEGFNQPTYRGMRIHGVRVATWSSDHGWSGTQNRANRLVSPEPTSLWAGSFPPEVWCSHRQKSSEADRL